MTEIKGPLFLFLLSSLFLELLLLLPEELFPSPPPPFPVLCALLYSLLSRLLFPLSLSLLALFPALRLVPPRQTIFFSVVSFSSHLTLFCTPYTSGILCSL